MTKLAVWGTIAIFFAACGGGDSNGNSDNAGGRSSNGGDGSSPSADSCDAFGHFGTP